MTRKHFEAIARAMHGNRPDRGNRYAPRSVQTKGESAYAQWERDVNAIARALAPFNAGFDCVRFLRACEGE